jgi:hypothetical protein
MYHNQVITTRATYSGDPRFISWPHSSASFLHNHSVFRRSVTAVLAKGARRHLMTVKWWGVMPAVPRFPSYCTFSKPMSRCPDGGCYDRPFCRPLIVITAKTPTQQSVLWQWITVPEEDNRYLPNCKTGSAIQNTAHIRRSGQRGGSGTWHICCLGNQIIYILSRV